MIQKIYDFFRYWKSPPWLKTLLSEIQELILSILYQVGKDTLREIQNQIIKVNEEKISGREKFEKVFNFCLLRLNLGHLRNNILDCLIQNLVSHLKKKNII